MSVLHKIKCCVFVYLLAMLNSPPGAQELQWPQQDAAGWLLAFVDVETTGLIPGHHEMIDIGIVMTDLEGKELGELFIRVQPEHPERTSEGARAVNAFDAGRWRELFHYFVLDVPSMAWGVGLRNLTGSALAEALQVEDEPHIAHLHTGITGAKLNARIYRALLAHAAKGNNHEQN